jgi:hypothetical protein
LITLNMSYKANSKGILLGAVILTNTWQKELNVTLSIRFRDSN